MQKKEGSHLNHLLTDLVLKAQFEINLPQMCFYTYKTQISSYKFELAIAI